MSKDININWDSEDLSPVTTELIISHLEELTKEPVNEIEELVQSCLVDLSKPIAKPPIAMEINNGDRNITLFTKGNFSIVAGKQKSKKSFLTSTFMATAIKGSFQNHLFCPTNGMNILFDTEQSEYKTQQIGRRILKLAGKEKADNFLLYTLRTQDPEKRLEIIENVLEKTPNLNYVVIDGIVDLAIDPILQVEQAQNIISKLMKWTEVYQIHITCVLHYNKTVSTLLGHLGSFAQRKADCVIEVAKDSENENTSFVSPLDCREMEFKPFAISVDEYGLVNIKTDIAERKSKAIKSEKQVRIKFTANSVNEEMHELILSNLFKKIKEYSYNELWRSLKQSIEFVCAESIGDNKAKEFITYYLAKEKIAKIEVKKKVLYTLLGQTQIEFNEAV